VTDCKKGLAPRGLKFLQTVCKSVSLSVYGIGGIKFDPAQWQELESAGAAGGCIMSGMMEL
jgi:thiamine-phosphate pyrophosphorylase